jgi:type II secretory ATPase GspE/PulE/Tfp pilus assembly ATPase PilB-like protein
MTMPSPILDPLAAARVVGEQAAQARELAARHGLEFVDLAAVRLDADLFHSIPFDLMLRYGFVPLAREAGRVVVAMKDPTEVGKLDELELQLGEPLEIRVASPVALDEILEKSESTQRVLDQATEEFRIQLVQEDERGDEVLSIDRITGRPVADHQARRLDGARTPSSAAPRTSTSRPATRRWSSSTASTACSTRRWSRSTSATTRPSSAASR